MNKVILGLILGGLSLTGPATASVSSPPKGTVQNEVVKHGGGCRKSSPAGKCCHAGSKPLHCH